MDRPIRIIFQSSVARATQRWLWVRYLIQRFLNLVLFILLPRALLRAVNRARRGALAKSKPGTLKTWYPVKHCACSTSNADKHFGFLVCFVLKVVLQENPSKAVGFANFIYLNQFSIFYQFIKRYQFCS
jgi:hypothetical protein